VSQEVGFGAARASEPEPVVDEVEIARAGPVAHLLAGLVPVLLGVGALGYSWSLSLGSATDPGPGLWPALVSALLLGAGLWSLVFERADRDCERFTRGAWGIGAGLVSLVVFVPLLGRIGFEIPTLLLLVFWLKVLGGESWRVSLAVSVTATAVLYALFVVALGVPIPRLAF